MTELLERENYLQLLEGHLEQATSGQGRLVLVGGEAGVGKTSLVDEFCRRIAGRAVILRTSCDALSTPGPLGPIRDLAPAIGLQIDRDGLDRDGRDRLFRSILDTIAARPDPTVLVGEDAHWADGASLEMLRFLARRIGELRLLDITTYRNDELGSSHPLRLALGDLAAAPAVHRISLPPLSEEAVATLAARYGRDARGLHQLTGGNPFYLAQILSEGGNGVPASVEDAVLARAARLSPDARAVLDVAAVIGAAVDTDLLAGVSGPVLDQLDECLDRGLLRVRDEQLVFSHALTRQAVLAAIPPPRRRLLHTRVLATLGERHDEDKNLALLAHHAEEAGDRDAVIEFATAAADQALAAHAHREAAAQFARVLRFGDRLPDNERAKLFEARSEACYLSDQGEEAIAARQAALAIWRRLDDPGKIGENLRWLSRLHWFMGRGDEAEEAGSAAVEILETLPPGPQLAMAYSNLSQLRMLSNDLHGAQHWGSRAIALAEEFGEIETLVHALTNVGTARQLEDDQWVADLERSLFLAQKAGLTEHAGRALINLAWNTLWAMKLDEADRRIATCLAYVTEHDLDHYRYYMLATRAALRALRGEWDDAIDETRKILQRPMLSPITRIVALTTLGQILARRGDPEHRAVLDEALALANRTGQLMRLGPVRAARAEAALLSGDRESVAAEALAIRDVAFARGSAWERGETAWLLWRAGQREVESAGLAEPYARQIAGDWRGGAAVWADLGLPYEEARALAEGDDPAAIRRAMTTFEQLGARPAAALAIRRLQALGVKDLPPIRRGPRPSTRAHPAGLTQRESEVLALVAAGLRNAEIADRLYLTPKTVSHHVSAILAKLGVRTRAEAVRAAIQLGIVADQSG